MIYDSKELHHLHKRKRLHQKLEPYLHPNKFKNFLDILIVTGIIIYS